MIRRDSHRDLVHRPLRVREGGAHNHFRLISVLKEIADLRLAESDRPAEDSRVDDSGLGGSTVATMSRQRAEAVGDEIGGRLRRTAVIELLLLVGVVALTGWLVNASTVA